ncbi:MAG: sigma-70 family RNA polymerase sigma factor [Marinovum sp.]|nr:sigma-70 family RNA polymerase sigma factor [Marinovum sp.]
MTETSDEDLLAAYVAGDRAAARMLTLRLTPRVLAQAMRMLQNHAEAEDVAQDALLRLWRIAPDWRRGEAKVSTWLWQVTANLCTDRLRKRGRSRPLDDAGDPADETPSAADQMQQSTRASVLNAALASLPHRQAHAVRLRHIEGLGNSEIAKILETSVEAVESLTARGCRALKVALAARREELGFTDDQ